MDNGTGCGMLLELAHAYASSAARPPHPVLFASVTAEEKGLLGSNYLGKHLPIPAAQIALDLNFDAVPPIGMPESVNVTGAERTTFFPVVRENGAAPSASIFNRTPSPAPATTTARIISAWRASECRPSRSTPRSSFVGHPPEWGKAQREEYTAKRYHQPSDEYTPDMDFSINAALAKFGFALGWQALTADRTRGWLPGDEFEAERQAR